MGRSCTPEPESPVATPEGTERSSAHRASTHGDIPESILGDMSMEEVVAEQKAILTALGQHDGGLAPWVLKREGRVQVA